ncbi:MAG: DNA polymerase I [Candidatus Riflebacteria bacterium]|nr:DNA polymerase I [Candidatus Riflebacteria bacterium]
MKKCLLIDGNNIVFRAYYAFANQRLKTKDGLLTGALYGFLRMTLNLLKEMKPDYVAIAFDVSRDTFRKKLYPEYKAHRSPVPDDLLLQIPMAEKSVEAMGIALLRNEDYEADDLIGSVAEKLKAEFEVQIVTGDRDLLQLIDKNVKVNLCRKGVSEMQLIDEAAFIEEYGFPPEGIIELKALMGDASDNIPGVRSVGEKRGLELIREYRTVDNLYANVDNLKKSKMKENIIADEEMARLSKTLATIKRDVNVFKDPSELAWSPDKLASEDFLEFLQRYELKSLYNEVTGNTLLDAAVAEPAAPKEFEAEILLVSDLKELKNYFKSNSEKYISLDIETGGLSFASDQIIGISFAYAENKAVYVPLAHFYLGMDPSVQPKLSELIDLMNLELKDKKLIGHNLKFDLQFLETSGFLHDENVFDTIIAAYLLDSAGSMSLKDLVRKEFNITAREYKDIAKPGEFASVDVNVAKDYCGQDAILALKLYKHYKTALKEAEQEKLYSEIEVPLMFVLKDMEVSGIALNVAYLREFKRSVQDAMAVSEEAIYDYAGAQFNVNSPKQLQEVLFGNLGLTPPKKTKTGYSTDSETLKKLAFVHPIAEELLNYRELAKIDSTYTDSLINLVNTYTGLIHTNFNQTVTATGRLSSSSPNLQNIPVKTELGRNIRRAFMPPEEGNIFISIDYSQIELRMLAHFSEDPALLKAYAENMDIHALTASRIFKKELKDVTSAERSIGKTVNFGIVYGISPFGLSQDLGVTVSEGKKYIDAFYDSFSGVTDFFDSLLKEARKTYEVSTILGRKRFVQDINAKNFTLRSAAERIVKNTKLQGSAADLVKKAMLDTVSWLKKASMNTKLILQIHDELIFSAPPDEAEQVSHELKKLMEKAFVLNVPLVCDVSSGPNLADLS